MIIENTAVVQNLFAVGVKHEEISSGGLFGGTVSAGGGDPAAGAVLSRKILQIIHSKYII